MTTEEFNSLELKDKVLYKGKILTIKKIHNHYSFRGITFEHNNEEIYPDIMYISFWTDIAKHQELIKLMIKIPNR